MCFTGLALNKTDADVYLAEHGTRPGIWLEEAGLLGPDAHIAHMIFLNDEEVALAGERQTGIAYCPVSHGIFGLGTMRLTDLVAAGASIGLVSPSMTKWPARTPSRYAEMPSPWIS